MNKYEELKEKYKYFYYHGFDYKVTDDFVSITYDIEIKDLIKFKPTLKVPYNKNVHYDEK